MVKVYRFLFCCFLLSACGSERQVEPKVPPVQKPPVEIPKGEIKFADVQAITDVSCKRCHVSDQFLKNETSWRGSVAKTRVGNNSMPPPGTAEARNITAADRAILTSF